MHLNTDVVTGTSVWLRPCLALPLVKPLPKLCIWLSGEHLIKSKGCVCAFCGFVKFCANFSWNLIDPEYAYIQH